MENPRGRGAHREHGDPAARLRFYARHGGRALDVPFFQPALRHTGRRVPDMLLVVLPPCPPTDAAGRLPGAAVRTFLAGYLREYEGGPGDDPGVRALWQAVDRPGGIPLLPLDDLDALPLSSAPR
ncbi:hypothetical protein ACFV3R_05040 [Streptomyces sp. NPDC059740]|uniref:hypothetical protein n=1 Tax=Streptomyces sp. NPDC059740 TaxID=3346926 RepID=UPI003651CED5